MLLPRMSTPPPGLSILPSHAFGPSSLPPLARELPSPGTNVDLWSYSYKAGGNLSTPHSCSQLSHLLDPQSSLEVERVEKMGLLQALGLQVV